MATTVDIVDLASGYWQSFALGAAVELGLFHKLAGGPVELAALAEAVPASEMHMEALLNSLCGLGLLGKSDAGYEVDPEQKPFLDPASPENMLGAFRFNLDLAKLWLKLPECIRSGEPVLPENPHLGKDPDKTRRFVEGMHSRAGLMARGLMPMLTPKAGARVLDVGGGPGTFSLKLAERDDSLHITVLDLPPVVEAARMIHAGNPAAERIRFMGGDYHRMDFPEEQDMILYCGALHQEPESGIEALLGKMKQALKSDGVLVVVDLMLDPDRSRPAYSALFQLNMMLMRPESRVYTSERLTELLQKTGFSTVDTREVPGTPYRMVKASMEKNESLVEEFRELRASSRCEETSIKELIDLQNRENQMTKPAIEIYYSEVCGLCHKALDFFRDRRLDFTAYGIGYDKEKDDWIPGPNVEEMKRRAGDVDFVPQIFINGTHIAGWKKLEPMIESGEFDKLLENA